MLLDQLTYGSANRSRMKGYQVLGQSEGVDGKTAKEFCRWAPSHGALGSDVDAWGLSFFQLARGTYCLARTMHGGPEYSGRGGLAVFTRALVVSARQLRRYDNDPIALARTAFALGHLILPETVSQSLAAAPLPDRPLPMDAPTSGFAAEHQPILAEHVVKWVARESASLLKQHGRVMVCGPCDALPILHLLFELVDEDARPEISFACGLQKSNHRRFQMQFTNQILDPSLQRQLAQQDIAPIDLSKVSS